MNSGGLGMPSLGGTVPADFDLVASRADALMGSLRATGYSLPDAGTS